MMNSQSFLITAFALASLNTYLFVEAPTPLTEDQYNPPIIPIEQIFQIVEAENDVVRALWTKEIVEAGIKVGFEFAEDWRDARIPAGPLPAIFLRETAKNLEKQPIRLSLYLGSDYPINTSNRFKGIQQEKFTIIKQTREPQFFYSGDTELYTGIFSDVAVSPSCVKCHNEHKQSAKNDWALNDVMGGTTWSYPSHSVTLDEAIEIVVALRKSIQDAYAAFLNKTSQFPKKPSIGNMWPRDGYFLPSTGVFMEKAAALASARTLNVLLSVAYPLPQVTRELLSNEELKEAVFKQDQEALSGPKRSTQDAS